MKKTLSLIALLITSVAIADVVENVVVDTSQAPSNYVVSYDLNTTGDWYYVEAVISDNDGADYQFAIGESRNPDRNKSPNFPAVFAPFDNEYTINTYLNTSSNYFFSFKIGRPLLIQNAKLKIIASKEKPIGILWKEITDAASWDGRIDHQSVAFDNKVWIIGGYYHNEDPYYKNDVWSSPNGTNWTEVTSAAPWSVRSDHQSVVFDNKIWVIGGYVTGSSKNDVWSSTDGINWTEVNSAAPWNGRNSHQSLVFDNKIWVIGGYDGSSKNDVWASPDGTNWIEVTPAAPWSIRYDHQSVVFDNKIWVIGGRGKNDVWSSPDGSNWTEVTFEAPWSGRSDHQSIVFDNKIWVIGGYDSSADINRNDVWSSPDGANWTQITLTYQWSRRSRHQSVVFDNKIWVIGGYDGNYLNDVWCSPPE